MQEPERIWHYVAPSDLHGQGVFARYDIPAGTVIMEYKGKRISPEQADEQPSADPDNPYHTFFFALSSGDIIDGAQQGNEARWINHSCEPNCEGHENEAGDQVFIIAKRDISADEELLYDYALTIDEPITDELIANYTCWCGSPTCRGTMLDIDPEKSPAAAQSPEPPGNAPASVIARLRPYIRQEVRRQVRRQWRQKLRRLRHNRRNH